MNEQSMQMTCNLLFTCQHSQNCTIMIHFILVCTKSSLCPTSSLSNAKPQPACCQVKMLQSTLVVLYFVWDGKNHFAGDGLDSLD
mmetsp:Transcript_31223/g.47833  ORF Transcript_31223/g.47833 Transcript_31223/m.47833 type:complete len:85 (+) Transcript_31223:366-620(+)